MYLEGVEHVIHDWLVNLPQAPTEARLQKLVHCQALRDLLSQEGFLLSWAEPHVGLHLGRAVRHLLQLLRLRVGYRAVGVWLQAGQRGDPDVDVSATCCQQSLPTIGDQISNMKVELTSGCMAAGRAACCPDVVVSSIYCH